MATITTEIKNAIVNEIVEELEEREYKYKTSHITTIVNEWFNQKGNLIDLFSKHPLWNPEKFMIQFDMDVERRICTEEIHNFVRWLQRTAGITYDYWKHQQQREWYITNFIDKIDNQFFDESMQTEIDEVNALNEKFKLRANMKASKAIGKICREEGWDKFPEYNQKYAALCDCLSPLKIKRHTVISLNPVDFLLMSNGNSWTSCHYIGDYSYDSGCYSSGTISYMLDKNSFVFYTVDASYDGTQVEREQKIQRQMFGYKDETLVQLRLYPASNDSGAEQVYADIREIVQKVIADCLEKPNIWVKSKKNAEDVAELGNCATCYPDWRNGNSGRLCTVSYIKDRTDGEDLPQIIFGEKPICISCGDRHDYENNISCCEYGYHYVCEHCGSRLHEDDVYWSGDYAYCGDCVTYCEECEEWVPNDEIVEVDGRYVCDYCVNNSDYISYCELCDKYHYTDNMTDVDGDYVCDYCMENNKEICKCEDCGEYHYVDNMIKVEDKYYCDFCVEHGEIVGRCEKCKRYHLIKKMIYDKESYDYICEACYAKEKGQDEGHKQLDAKEEVDIIIKTSDDSFTCNRCNKNLKTCYRIKDKDTGDDYCKDCYDNILIDKKKTLALV